MREHPVTLNEFKSPDPDASHLSSELTYRTDLLNAGNLENAEKWDNAQDKTMSNLAKGRKGIFANYNW